jgi:RNA polymerase sigma-70 factor (ECF subfamily)
MSDKNYRARPNILMEEIHAEESRIIDEVLNGRKESYVLLIDRYKVQIFNLAYRMTASREDANDLAQETFTKAYENLKKYNKNKPFFPWLYAVGLNLIRNHIKRKKKILKRRLEDMIDFKEKEATPANPEVILSDEQKIKKLEASIENLSEEQKEAIILRYYRGLQFEYIAEVMGVSISAAKMRVYRGLEKLRDMM